MPDYTNASIERLMRAVAMIETPEECKALFDDLCTIKEMQNMAMRLDTAIMLSRRENYQAISRDVGVSTATISRVSRNYYYGSGGYQRIIKRLEEAERNEE